MMNTTDDDPNDEGQVQESVGGTRCLRGCPSAVVYSTSNQAVTPIFAVDVNALDFVMKEEAEDDLRTGCAFENVVIEGGARGVMNRREGQRSWWGSGMFW
jgi:hypothetical protein